jgi:hypothetical protein
MNKGYGFWADGKFYLKRCYDCGCENWGPAVATGQCAWCGSEKRPEPEKTATTEQKK